MTGTVTATREFYPGGQKITIDWKSDASGDVLASLMDDLDLGRVAGKLLFVETAPGENGDLTTDLPTADYDVYLKDDSSFNWLGALGVNKSGTVAEVVPGILTMDSVDYPVIFLGQDISLVVDNAGNAKRGRVTLFLQSLLY